MPVPAEAYPILADLAQHLPHLRAADHRALTWWVSGMILAGSACESAVLAALTPLVGRTHRDALRQMLREVFKDGADHATPNPTDLVVETCFAPLLGWVLSWWHGSTVPLALDATLLRDRLAVICVSVLYRGTAIPVAWHVTAANTPGAWLESAIALFDRLADAVPSESLTLVLADRGLWSPALWQAIQAHGWHPLLRIRSDATFAPTGGKRVAARTLVPGAGQTWIGTGVAYKQASVRQAATLVGTWEAEQTEPWLLLTDLPPTDVGPCWYGVRTWIELGFRTVKSMGWQWERTRRTDPDRVARHWLVLAVATLWTVATGTREEDAERLGRAPSSLRIAQPPPTAPPFRRTISLFVQGLARLRWQRLRTRRLWSRRWLWPEALPLAPPGLVVTVVMCHFPFDTYPSQLTLGEGLTRVCSQAAPPFP